MTPRLQRHESVQEIKLNYIDSAELAVNGCATAVVDPSPDLHSFLFVGQGRAQISLVRGVAGGARNTPVEAGECFLLPPECRATIRNGHEEEVRLIRIRFFCALVKRHGSRVNVHPSFLEPPEELHVFRMPQAFGWIQDFLGQREKKGLEFPFLLQSHLYAFAAFFLRSKEESKPGVPHLGAYVERMKEHMEKKYYEPMDVEQIGKASGSGTSRFYRAFRRRTGFSPNQYLTKLRLDASLPMLAGESGSVAAVAHAVGYEDEYYFSRLFKRHMGVSPTEYAYSAKRSIVATIPDFVGDAAVLGLKAVWKEEPAEHGADLILTHAAQKPGNVSGGNTLVFDEHRDTCKEKVVRIAAALGLGTLAERWLDQCRQKTELAREALRLRWDNQKILIVHKAQDRLGVLGSDYRPWSELFYRELALEPPAPARGTDWLTPASWEALAGLESGHAILLAEESEAEAGEERLLGYWKQAGSNGLKGDVMVLTYRRALYADAQVYESLIDQILAKVGS